MREVIIRIRCNKCSVELNEEVNDCAFKATIGGKSYGGDLCLSCANKVLENLCEVKPRKTKSGASGSYACDQCDQRFTRKNGLSRHKNNNHVTL